MQTLPPGIICYHRGTRWRSPTYSLLTATLHRSQVIGANEDEHTRLLPCATARAAGFFYLLTFVLGIGALSLVRGLVISAGPAATAANVLAHPALFRLNFAADLLAGACYIVVTVLFLRLFRPVNPTVSLLAAFFSLTGGAVGAISYLFYLLPLTILSGAPYLYAFTPDQLQVTAMLSIKIGGQANGLSLVFFGFYCLLIGYLVFRPTFLPRAIGVLMCLAGLGWLTFLSPPLAAALSPYNLLPGTVGELSLTLWLLFAGLNSQRWHEQARTAADSQSEL